MFNFPLFAPGGRENLNFLCVGRAIMQFIITKGWQKKKLKTLPFQV